MTMEVKTIEIRDRMTFIPALAVRVSGADDRLLWRAGFSPDPGEYAVILVHLTKQEGKYDPYEWKDRTMQVSHLYLEKEWANLANGAVVDVEFILKETAAPKVSEVTR